MDEEKDAGMDDDIRISYRNMLWLIYRALSEDMLTTDELEEIGYKIM